MQDILSEIIRGDVICACFGSANEKYRQGEIAKTVSACNSDCEDVLRTVRKGGPKTIIHGFIRGESVFGTLFFRSFAHFDK